MLKELGLITIKNYSRYMTNGSNVINVRSLIPLTKRKDGRFNMIRDDGKRFPISINGLKLKI